LLRRGFLSHSPGQRSGESPKSQIASKVFRSDADENANGRFFDESLSSSPNQRDFVCCQQPNAFLERIFGLKTTINPGKHASLYCGEGAGVETCLSLCPGALCSVPCITGRESPGTLLWGKVQE
jgi:hypothetical protein